MKPASRPDFVARVAAFVRANALFAGGEKAAVALSGGPDSVALLLALVRGAERGILPAPCGVLHFHHGIRGADADEEAAFCAGLAARFGLPCVIGLGVVPQKNGGYSNADARRARYDFLSESARDLGANLIATAHTKSDQAETVLWRVVRGTGLSGLSGIPPRRALDSDLSVIRPLLGETRDAIEGFCLSENITPRRDPTNENAQFTRVRMRRILPELARDFNPRLSDALPRLAAHAARDADLLDDLAGNLWAETVLPAPNASGVRLAAPPLRAAHPALRTRVLLRALRRAAQNTRQSDETATDYFVQILDDLLLRGSGASADLPGKVRAVCNGETLTLAPASAETASAAPYEMPLVVGKTTVLPLSLRLHISAQRAETAASNAAGFSRRSQTIWIAYPSEPGANGTIQPNNAPNTPPNPAPLFVRNARTGDRIAPLGMDGKTRLVRDVLAEAKVPKEERDTFPLIVRGDTGAVLWIIGVMQAEETRITPQTPHVLCLSAHTPKE